MQHPSGSIAVKSLQEPVPSAGDRLLIAIIFVGMVGFAYAVFTSPLLQPIITAAQKQQWNALLLRPTVIWVAMGFLLLFLRTILWLGYRPFQAVADEEAPWLSVIIPAFNEGRMVERAIASVAKANYPKDHLEIIAVDDGSKDNTWNYISRAAIRFPDIVVPVRLASNRGKRGALAVGFSRAKGEVIVTVDSDSVIEPEALLAIAGPFRDPRIGAVAGKVAVLNRMSSILPRMLHVRFILSFDFLRSVQSVFRTVYCCPGALTAYRESVVRQVSRSWEHQTFFGVPCTYGEDRGMTNCILEAGYDTVYQRTAVVHTVVPETYTNLCKMYLRWDRSYIREELRFARIVWKRPLVAKVLAIYECTMSNLRYPIAYLALGLLVMNVTRDPGTLFRMLLAIMIAATFYVLYYLRSERSWDFVFGILYAYFSFFALTWIFPYALLTVRARGWLTR
jgi:hyaluronan synthase